MNLYNFYKIFRCGQKEGQRSKNPTAGIAAFSEAEAWTEFKKHDKYREKIKYICIDEGLAGAEETSTAGQKKPGEWSIGDHCWTRLNPFDDDDTSYHEGVILGIEQDVEPAVIEAKMFPDVKKGPIYSVWLTGDFASWRSRRASQILVLPPKGKRRRRRNRPGRQTRVVPVKKIRRKK